MTTTTPTTPRIVRAAAAVLATITATVALAWFVIAATPAPAHADALCDAMRARFGPGYPCISVPTNTFTPTAPAGPTTTGPGGQSSGGPQVGIDVGPGPGEGNGTPIVPVPGAPTYALPGNTPAPTPTAPAVPGTQNGVQTPGGASSGNDRSPTGQPAPAAPAPSSARPPSSSAAAPTPSPASNNTSTATTASAGADDSAPTDDTQQMLWLLAGAAAIVAGASSTRLYGDRRPLSVVAADGGYPSISAALRSWLPGGGSERATIGTSQYVLINDPTSPRSYVFNEDVPPGGHIAVNPDGSATIYDKNGRPVSTIAKPWAYDSLGRPQRTWYTIGSDGRLIQHIDPTPDALYPILADPLSGGEDPTTGKSITATPLANGQEAVEGEGNGTQVVGTPDPGRTPYQPNTDTMLPDRQISVDQGDGNTEVTQTDNDGQAETSSISTQESYDNTVNEIAQQQESARQAQQDREDEWNGKWDGDLSKEGESYSADADTSSGSNGLSATASASRTASKYTAEGGYSNKRDGYELSGKAEVGTGADAEATAEATTDGAGIKLGGFAGGKAGISATEGSPSTVQLSGGAGVRAGIGADIGFGAMKQEGGGWKVGLNVGAAFGPGVEGNVSLNVNPGKLAHALNPLNW